MEKRSTNNKELIKLTIESPRPNLIARWEIENNKLVCRWVVDDRPRRPFDHP